MELIPWTFSKSVKSRGYHQLCYLLHDLNPLSLSQLLEAECSSDERTVLHSRHGPTSQASKRPKEIKAIEQGNSGYWQIKITKRRHGNMAFKSHHSLFGITCIPFQDKNQEWFNEQGTPTHESEVADFVCISM